MKVFEKMSEYVREQKPFILVTIVEARGSVPQESGARMMADQNGLVAGTVGGGESERHALEVACRMLESSNSAKTQFLTWNLQRDFQMNCGGEIRLYFEKWNETGWNFHIFGAGHVAQAIVPVLLTFDARITCVDSRQEWLDRLPKNDRLRTLCVSENDFANAAAKTPTGSWCLVMTRDHGLDAEVVQALLKREMPPYLGVIGSKLKAVKMKAALLEGGIEQERVDSVLCPIGLKFGKNTPAEIAVSIAAQILTVRDSLEASRPVSVVSRREAELATAPSSH